jgi:hypothetical protein
MKTLARFFVLTVAGAIAAHGQTTGIRHPPNRAIVPSERIQVRAAVEPANAKSGTPLIVKLVSKNVWYNVVTVSDYGADVDYELIIVDTAGKEVPRTAAGDRLFRGEYVLLHTMPAYLDPGQEIRAEIEVTKIYQLTQPGIYYMWATRDPLPGSPDETKLTGDLSKLPIERAFSNPVQFTIVP